MIKNVSFLFLGHPLFLKNWKLGADLQCLQNKALTSDINIAQLKSVVKEAKTEWVQVQANLIHFAIYSMKSKQT